MKTLALLAAFSLLLGLWLVAPARAQQEGGLIKINAHWGPSLGWRSFGPSWGSHFPPSPSWRPFPQYPSPYRDNFFPPSYRRYVPGRYIQVWIPPQHVEVWTRYGWEQIQVREGYYSPVWIPGRWE